MPLLAGCTPITPATLLEQLLIGLILGSVYALIALGYTLVYGVIKLINFAHGDIYMLGAFAGYYLLRFLIRWLNFGYGVDLLWCFVLSILGSALICAVLAIVMERLAYRPLRNSSRIAALITAVGVSFLLENLGIIAFGANPKSYEPKTLGVYQIELAAGDEFSDAINYEVVETTQLRVPRTQFDGTFYARSRVVARTGASDWGPTLAIPADGTATGFVELPPLSIPGQTQRPASIGYAIERDDGREVVVLTWPRARSSDIALSPMFADERGRARALVLSVGGTPVRVPYLNLVILSSTLIVLALLNLLINRSLFGISMRALSFDLSAAKLMGVNTDSVIALTFAIGGACAALAGNLVGMYNQTIEPLMGILPGLKAFVAAVVGGIGSIPGAAVGGLIMGLSESLVKTFIPPRYSALSDALAFALLIAVLLIKPTGIFGRATKEKV